MCAQTDKCEENKEGDTAKEVGYIEGLCKLRRMNQAEQTSNCEIRLAAATNYRVYACKCGGEVRKPLK